MQQQVNNDKIIELIEAVNDGIDRIEVFNIAADTVEAVNEDILVENQANL